jgi:hypothetical protein
LKVPPATLARPYFGRRSTPPVTGGVMRMNAAQLAALLSGMDWTRMHAPRIVRPKEVV